MANQYQSIAYRGNFLADPYFESARGTLEQLLQEFQQNRQVPLANNNIDYLLTQLSAWQQSSQNIETNLAAIEQSEVLSTVIKFEADHFKMLIDVRGFKFSELKVSISLAGVELIVSQEGCAQGLRSKGYASRDIKRTYQLPYPPAADQAECNLSADGTLVICAKWLKLI